MKSNCLFGNEMEGKTPALRGRKPALCRLSDYSLFSSSAGKVQRLSPLLHYAGKATAFGEVSAGTPVSASISCLARPATAPLRLTIFWLSSRVSGCCCLEISVVVDSVSMLRINSRSDILSRKSSLVSPLGFLYWPVVTPGPALEISSVRAFRGFRCLVDGRFRIYGFLNSFPANLGQPHFERLGFGWRNKLDNAEKLLGKYSYHILNRKVPFLSIHPQRYDFLSSKAE